MLFIVNIQSREWFLLFFILDSPICGFDEPQIVGVAMMESVELICDVISNPNRLVFHWNLNKSVDGDPLTTFSTNKSR